MSAPDDAPKSFEFLLRLGRLHMLQKGSLRGEGRFPLQAQATRTISAVPRALKRFMNEQANAMCSREPANDADVDFGGLAIGVPCGDALAEGLETAHLCLSAATGMVSGSSFPERPAVMARGAQGFVARPGGWAILLPRSAVPADRE
jgi:hypothetical protein